MSGFRMKRSLNAFEYFSPETIGEAVSIVAEYQREGLRVLAGGTDLLPMIMDRLVEPKYILNLKNVSGLDAIHEGPEMAIGSLAKIVRIQESRSIKERYLAIHEATKHFATPQVRNMATIGGNICRSSPSADLVPPLLVLDAELKLIGPAGERRVLLEHFFTGPGTNVMDREILTEIIIPPQEALLGTAFGKMTRNSADLAKVNVAVKIVMSHGRCDNIAIALGGVAPTPVRASMTEELLKGRTMDQQTLEEAVHQISREIAPITDVRSTAQYRAQVTPILVRKLLSQAIHRANATAAV